MRTPTRGRPLGLRRGKKPRFGSLPTSEQGELPYRAAECQLYAQIQDPPCFTCFRLKWKFGRYGPLARV